MNNGRPCSNSWSAYLNTTDCRTGCTWTALELWLMRQGIKVGHSSPYHPQTQGKLERFHRSLKAEVLQGKWFTDAGELQRAFDHWRTVYNLERPYEALDMAVPASRYQPSARQFRSNVEPPEYDEGVVVRKVDIRGKLSLRGVSLSAGKAFRNERLGLKETQEDGQYEVWWYSTKVGVIDLKNKSITMAKNVKKCSPCPRTPVYHVSGSYTGEPGRVSDGY